MSIGKMLSPMTIKILGPDWEPRPDCWQWEEEVKTIEPVATPVKELPMPKYCRPLSEIRKQIWARVASDDEIIARLTGKV
jgi:hypothetical protein